MPARMTTQFANDSGKFRNPVFARSAMLARRTAMSQVRQSFDYQTPGEAWTEQWPI
jgi:hypothetical protein